MDAWMLVPLMGMSIPIVAIVTSHQRAMAKIKADAGGFVQNTSGVSSEVLQELTALRQEVAALRDTTTRFDMSFDAAITRLEDRMERVETRQDTPSASSLVQTVGTGGR